MWEEKPTGETLVLHENGIHQRIIFIYQNKAMFFKPSHESK